ncbi:MAG TPA: hypothetical protein EYH54_03880, partial [Nautiliaceae bacterium]|nr:hypothetical protein [Nautiliaceae bacterium]
MKVFISFLIGIIIVSLIVTYVKISTPEIEKVEQKKEEKVKSLLKEEKIINFSFNKFFFPARELNIKIDFEKGKRVILYKVTLDGDRFALFNIKTILNQENISYSLIESKKTEIYIVFKSLKEAEKVLKIFKEYNF